MPFGPTALLDANILYPANLRDFLLQLAAADFFEPRWSDEIHNEWIENLLKNNTNLSREKLEATRAQMNRFFPQSVVTDYEDLIPQLTNAPKDRHVLAAAIQSQAQYIVTINLKDFKATDLAPHGVQAIHPDKFALDLYRASPLLMVNAINEHRAILKRPPKTAQTYLDDLARNHLTQTAAILQKHLDEM